jgi:hypothetical protein
MTLADARSATRADEESAVAGLVAGKWLRLAAAPSFAIMALLTVVLDDGLQNALCLATGYFRLDGMVPMYLLMGVFHLAPWVDLISRRRNVARHSR